MAATFSVVATLAAVGGGWAVQANEYGRYAALALLVVFGITLLFPALADRLTRPVVALGSHLSETADRRAGTSGSSILPSLLLGVATGLLWAPCAGPVLGLILTGAALEGANVQTSLLLVAYAAGAATSLALALIIGGRVFTVMKRSLGAGEWVRRGLGVAVLAGVVVIALGLDTRFLTQVSLASTAPLEQGLVDKLHSVASDQRPTGGRPLAMTGNPPVTTENRPEAQAQPLEGGGPVAMTGNPPPAMQPEQPKTKIEDFADEGAMP
jgi:cytochrome c biogenesis protein CcdA